MKHFGDITKINGANVPPVDVITGGSPCQDLSVAGKRAGLAGERSGLFMEQIRVIKEMREHDREIRVRGTDNLPRPRYMVWENVPGALSSNGGEDFRAVLEETAKIADENAVIPRPPKGKWTSAGAIMGDGWSIAWRIHDAQFWGVPQRRRRIALVADFGGESAPEILFEREGLPRDFEESGEEGQEAAGDTGDGVEETGRCLNGWDVQSKHIQPEDGVAEALYAGECRGGGGESYVMAKSVVYGICSFDSNAMKSPNPNSGIYEAETARTLDLNGGSPACNQGGMAVVCATTEITPKVDDKGIAFSLRSRDYKDPQVIALQGNMIGRKDENGPQGSGINEGVSFTLNATDRHAVCQPLLFEPRSQDGVPRIHGEVSPTLNTAQGGQRQPCICMAVGNGQLNQISMAEIANTLDTMHDQQAVMGYQNTGRGWWNEGETGATIRGSGGGGAMEANVVVAVDCRNGAENPEINGTLQAKPNGGFSLNCNTICRQGYIVRRLTPLECERLQGYPSGWTDIGDLTDSKGKKHKAADSPRYKALGNSIALPFWQWMAHRMVEHLGDHPTMASLFDGIGGFPLVFSRAGCEPVWASEIEEFPLAVTKIRFAEVD